MHQKKGFGAHEWAGLEPSIMSLNVECHLYSVEGAKSWGGEQAVQEEAMHNGKHC